MKFFHQAAQKGQQHQETEPVTAMNHFYAKREILKSGTECFMNNFTQRRATYTYKTQKHFR